MVSDDLKKKFNEERAAESARKRQIIIDDAQAMRRLVENEDFKRFIVVLNEEKQSVNAALIDKYTYASRTNEEKISLIARINQIESVIKKPRSLIWQMENLTEVRGAVKNKTRERQALGKKTGGQYE